MEPVEGTLLAHPPTPSRPAPSDTHGNRRDHKAAKVKAEADDEPKK